MDLHFLIRPGVGYMHVSGFQETTEREVQSALDEMGDEIRRRGNEFGSVTGGRAAAAGSIFRWYGIPLC